MEDWLAVQRRARSTSLALTYQGLSWNYGQLDDLVQGWCGRLTWLCLQPGDRLAVHLANSPAYVGLIHAAARLGLVLAPLNTRLTLPELTWQLKQLEVRYVVSDSLTQSSLADAGCDCQVTSTAVLQAMPEQNFLVSPLELENVQAIIFTSGTSGTPKAAQVTFGQHFWSALGSAFRLGILPEDRWLSVLPLYHVGGLAVIFRSCLYGTAIDLNAGFDLDSIARCLQVEPITMISLVPTMLRRMLTAGVQFPASLRLLLLGGAGAPLDLLAECAMLKVPVAVTYGLTEAASQVATLPPNAVRHKPGCVGKPLLWNQLQIRDSAGGALLPGEIGEICVAGPVVMPGYWRDEAASQLALRGGWLHTGDLGYLDEQGDLWVVQRRSDLILSGGENVYPAEVEVALRQHPAVADICVVGIPDDDWGQRVAAAVVVRSGQILTDTDLIEYSRSRLAGYKLPRQVCFIDALPLTASGKVSRQQVVELFSQPSGASEENHAS